MESRANDTSESAKKHAACDECRTRKLKCSGDLPKCSRCEREGLRCEYSPQKQMGRPKKRQRQEEGESSDQRNDQNANRVSLPSLNDLALQHELGLGEYGALGHAFQCDRLPNNTVEINLEGTPRNESARSETTDPYLNAWQGIQACEIVQRQISRDHDHLPQQQQQQHHQQVSPPDSLTRNSDGQSPETLFSLSDPYPPAPPCACLSTMYLNLSTLSSLRVFHFPHILSPIRQSLTTASTVLVCEHCPLDTSASLQNTGVLSTLLHSVADRMFKALSAIDTEAARLETTKTTRTFRIGDSSPESNHLHDGTPDCPAAFMIELSGTEWRKLSRRAIEAEVGRTPGRPKNRTLLGVVDGLVERQKRWHTDPEMMKLCDHMYGGTGAWPPGSGGNREESGSDTQGERAGHNHSGHHHSHEVNTEELECVRGAVRLRRMVELMGFDKD